MKKNSNKSKKAVALKYTNNQDTAPRLTAKGSGSVAERILALAKEHDIPIHEDRDMVEILSRMNIGDEIPEYLYKAIAEVLAYVYRLNKNNAEKKGK